MADDIDKLQLSAEDRKMINTMAELRKHAIRHGTPRARELVRTIDDFASEMTGDRDFFITRGHKIPL